MYIIPLWRGRPLVGRRVAADIPSLRVVHRVHAFWDEDEKSVPLQLDIVTCNQWNLEFMLK